MLRHRRAGQRGSALILSLREPQRWARPLGKGGDSVGKGGEGGAWDGGRDSRGLGVAWLVLGMNFLPILGAQFLLFNPRGGFSGIFFFFFQKNPGKKGIFSGRFFCLGNFFFFFWKKKKKTPLGVGFLLGNFMGLHSSTLTHRASPQ